MKKKIKNKYFITSLSTILIYIVYLKMMKIFPYGENSILKSDLYQQYVNFLCYFREVLLNGKSIIISWNLGLANNFYTTFAYYLISPINILVIFFNSNNMDLFVEIITPIKIVLMSNFFVLFLEKSYKYKNSESIIFGIIYAFSSYVICYSFHIMWLDSLYMLPIVLIFVDKYIKDGKIWPLVLGLSYTILTNYYMGYIVAFFSGIYFLSKMFIEEKNIKCIFKFLLAIIISFSIGMIVILPSLLQLMGKMSADVRLIKWDLDNIKLLSNVIFNNYIYAFAQKSCLLFSSTLIILLLPMYYLNENIKAKEKIAFSLVIIFLLLPIISPFFNKLWHAFTTPNCFNYRYSFTLIFLSILMAAREWQNRRYSKIWHFVFSAMIFLAFTIIEIVLYSKGSLKIDNFEVTLKSIIISCMVYLAMFIICLAISNLEKADKLLKKMLALSIMAIVVADLLLGAKSGQNNNDIYFKREHFLQYNNLMEHLKGKLKVPEAERIVFQPDEYCNDMSLRFEYSSIGYFTSARNRDVLKAMYKLGYNVQMDEQLWITSYSGTFLNYDIAGVKYYITKNKIEDNEIYGFELEEKYDNFYIYKNKNQFNIGYYLKENIKESGNPFEMQNSIMKNLNDISNNSSETEADLYFQKIENAKVLKCSKNIEYNEEECVLKYDLKAKEDCNLYLSSNYNLQLYINNKPQFTEYSNIWGRETGIKQIKKLNKNEEFEFKIVTKQSLENLHLYVSNNSKIQEAFNNKESNTFENVKFQKNGLKGITKFREDGYLVFSIAYDKCWNIYVDDKKVKKEAIAGCFLGTRLKKGTHQVEIKANRII